MSIETVRIKDLEEVSVNDIEQMWVPVDSAAPDSTNKVKLSAFAAYVGGISDGKYIPLVGSTQITGSLVPSVADAALGSGSHKWLSLFAGGVHASDLLAIPQAAPSDPDPLESYLYCNASGNYAETPSGGVANIFDLYIKNGGLRVGPYNLGVQDQTADISSLFGGYATEAWVTSNFNNYTLPTASSSTKGGIKVGSTLTISSEVLNVVTGSVTQSNTGFVTGGDVYSAIAAAVTSALHYRGISSTALTDGGTETATIGGVALTPQSGDVVIYGGFEFLWENNVWNKLGDDTSYALKTVTIFGDGTYITGGGDLTTARTLTLGSGVITSLGKADTAYQKPSGGIPASDLADAYLKLVGNSVATKITGDVYMTRGKYLKMVESNGTDSVALLGISSSGAWFTLGNGSYRAEISSNSSNIVHVKSGVSYAVYDESNLTKSVLTTLLESDSGYYVKKSGDTMTGDLTFDASSAAKEIKFGYASSGSGSAVKMGNDGKLYFGADQLTNNKDTYLYGGNISISWHREAIAGGNVAVFGSGNNFAPSKNDSIYLGHGSYRWATVYGVNFNASGTLTVTGVSTLSGGAKVSTMLAIPQSAPSSSASWYSANDYYLYANTSGNYSESAGGGVSDVYPLTLTINGTSTVYNPGTAAQTISFLAPTSAQITAWNAKYDKPSGGIPKTDLASAVQTSLGKADTALQSVAFSDLTTHPTTISGYGITDAKIETPSGTSNRKITLGSNNFTIYAWALASSKPSYNFSEIGSKPTTLSGYGITDAQPLDADLTAIAGLSGSSGLLKKTAANTWALDTSTYLTSVAFSDLTAHPTTLSGYGITDAKIANGVITLGNNTITPYTSSNLSLATLAGSSAIGSSTQPVYYTGSALAVCNAYSTILSSVSGGVLSSSGNLLSLTALSVVAGGTTKSNAASSNVKIVNSLSVSALSSTSAKNLALKITVNGQESAEASVTDLFADKATSLETTTETGAEFTTRSTPSVAVGDSGVITKIYGNTIVSGNTLVNLTAKKSVLLNQQAKAYDSSDWAVLTYTTKTTDAATQSIIVTSSNNASAAKGVKLNNFSFVTGHKYYIRAEFESGHIGFYNSSGGVIFRSTESGVGVVGEVTSSTSYFGCRIGNATASGTSYRFRNIMCVDLTLMYGSGYEPTASEFEHDFPQDYIPYNATGVSVDIYGGLQTSGTGWTSLLPLPITTITSGGVLVFSDGMKSANTVYDELTRDKAIKKVGKVDLGTLTWNLASNRFYAQISGCSSRTSGVSNMITAAYPTRNNASSSISGVQNNGEYCQSQNYVVIYDTTYTTTSAFKTAMSGVYLYFELATPIEYTLDSPIPLFFKSDKLGTQTLVPENTSVISTAPLKADFQYGSNLGDSAEANEGYLQKNGGRVSGELNVAGALAVPTSAPKNPEVGKYYLYVNPSGNYAQ